MTTKKTYGPWIKWRGGECPVPPDTMVKVKLRCLTAGESRAGDYYWNHDTDDDDGDIVEYHTITEQPDLEAAESLLRANGYAITPPAKPLTFEDVVPMTEAPEKGVRYWAVHPFDVTGVAFVTWQNDICDQSALRHRAAYLEREHALIAARHIFGLKGGEL